MTFRLATAYLICPILKVTGFRFSKDYRHGVSRFHRAVYRVVSTIDANHLAGLDLTHFTTHFPRTDR